MERDQFTFYRSFWEALKALPKKDQLPFIVAIGSYVFEDESKPLAGASAAAFLLVKPILDKASKRAANGKQGGSKPKANGKQTESKPEANQKQTGSKSEANQKQTGSHIEGEKEIEGDVEREREEEEEDEYPPTPFVVNVVQTSEAVKDFLDRVNPSAPVSVLQELAEFEKHLSTAVCKRAFDVALGERKTNWSYVRGILRNCQSRGIRCLADWNALEQGRESFGCAPAAQGKNDNIFAEMLREEGGFP